MKNTIRLWVFRHGETQWNVEQRFQGHLDIPLNPTGILQAEALARKLKAYPIEAILSSDLSRALETSQRIAQHLEVPVFQDARLREAHLGAAQGLTRDEIEKLLGEQALQRWKSNRVGDAEVSYPGGETGLQVITRVFQSLQEFLNSQPFSEIGVGTHGGVIRRMFQKVLPQDHPHLPIPNTAVFEFHYDPATGQFTLAERFFDRESGD